MDYEKLTYLREDNVTGVGPWTWITDDLETWHGPKKDWHIHYNTILKYVKKFDVVAQAGGCLGVYPRLLSDMFKLVYTWEPDPLNFFCLTRNCQKNNIIKMQAALGEKHQNGHVYRTTALKNVGMNIVQPLPPPEYIHPTWVPVEFPIPILKIDDFVFDTLDLLWFDLELSELPALVGAQNTIKLHHPVIIAENPREEINTFLHQFGYEFMELSIDGIYVAK